MSIASKTNASTHKFRDDEGRARSQGRLIYGHTRPVDWHPECR